MKASFYTLGCKVNQAETKQISEQFTAKGYNIVPFTEAADVVVINTCSVTHVAERKSRNLIRRVHKLNPQAHIVVCGCYANLENQDLKIEIPEISEIVPQNIKLDISHWNIPIPRKQTSKPTPLARPREFLKIQDGCDQFCSYCVIPYARSELISLPPAELLEQAKTMAEHGVTEIILTGINIGKYNNDLPKLIQNIATLKNILRIRLSSIEPNLITPELLTVMQNEPKLARHLHIPLQSGSDQLLKAMNRRYNTTEYLKVLETVRKYLPNPGITTDIILGFPGETEKTFQETLATIARAGLSDAHLFKYSRRARTKAYDLKDTVSIEQVDTMFTELTKAISKTRQDFLEKMLNKESDILIDAIKPQHVEGLTSEYIRVILPKQKTPLGQLVKVKFERSLLPKQSPSAEL